MNKIAIVILNYVTYELTLQCLDNLKHICNEQFFIIVVDNCSPNESGDILSNKCNLMRRENELEIFFLKSEKNAGYSAGNNLGIKFAECKGAKYVVIMNNDIKLDSSNVFQESVSIFKEDNSVSIVGPKVITNNIVEPPLALGRPSICKILLKNFLLPLYILMFNAKRKSRIEHTKKIEVYAVSGCFFIADILKLKEIGYLDEKVFLYAEELILGEKMYNKNYKIIFDPNVYVNHLHSQTISNFYSIKKREKIRDTSLEYYYSQRKDVNAMLKVFLRFSFYFKKKVMLPLSLALKIKV